MIALEEVNDYSPELVYFSETAGNDANNAITSDLIESAKRDMWKLRTGKRDPIW